MYRIIIGLLLFIASATNAYAYLDPGTGSYILQIVIGSVLAGGYFFREKLSAISTLVKKIFKKK